MLFDKAKSTISEHISHIFEEKELERESVVRKFRTTAVDGKDYEVSYFNLDVIISVGYRVKSLRGTQFRQWATQCLREYIVKGFTMDDERIMRNGQSKYFDELLTRIRNIRSSEKLFWEKVLDIFATSIDYNKNSETARTFFSTIQNKMHFAVHGHTAAELIMERCSAEKPNIGMTNWIGSKITSKEAVVAKNYLSIDELEVLNRIVNAYLEIADLQARMQRPMYMRDWQVNLDNVILMTGMDVLDHSGKVSHEAMLEKVQEQYRIYTAKMLKEANCVEKDFIEFIQKTKQLDEKRKENL